MPVFGRQMRRRRPKFVLRVERSRIIEQLLRRRRIFGLRNVTQFSRVDLSNELLDLRLGETES